MPNPLSGRQAELRAAITAFLTERRDGKLDKLKPDDPKHAELHAQFEFTTWIDDAARRVSQIQAVTHSLKPVHPDAKGTNFYSPPTSLHAHAHVSSHALGDNFAGDVVGNAAALDVHKFLKLAHDGRTLLELMLARDADLAAALSADAAQAEAWMVAFAGITQARGKSASHTLAKQLYWLVGDDARDDSDYHLLSPLYASSLAHRVFETINDDRFSEAAKAARQARREGQFSDRPVHEYTQLAVQKLGGTKPQNISQLNSERGGKNYLLASLPPVWVSLDLKPLLRADSLFRRYERRPEVKRLLKELLRFLKSGPRNNLDTRERRDALVEALLDELLAFVADLRNLPSGWSQQPGCELSAAEKHWLDPDGVATAAHAAGLPMPTDSAQTLSEAFAGWLNEHLRDPLPMGDPEYRHWLMLALEQLEAEDWEVSHAG